MKIIRVTGFVVAPDGVDEGEVIETIKGNLSGLDCVVKPFIAESSNIGSDEGFFDGTFDNHPLNEMNCTLETCKKYWNKGEK